MHFFGAICLGLVDLTHGLFSLHGNNMLSELGQESEDPPVQSQDTEWHYRRRRRSSNY